MKAFLLYHDVIAAGQVSGFHGASAEHYKVSTECFRRHLQIIRDAGPDNLHFTFDDAGASAMHTADLLESFGRHGIFFVPTKFVAAAGFCTRSDIQELTRRGHSIGSHSHTHPIPISELADDDLQSEWTISRSILEDLLGTRVERASVPGGFASTRVIQSIRKAGFTQVFTSEPTRALSNLDGGEIHGRFSVTRSTSDRVIRLLANGSSLPWWQQGSTWMVKKVLKRVGGKYWLRAREEVMSARQGLRG
jgi:peptidoglycan/xylan/chitin deacetylase (PgdA/CDA1 family)